ncbi:hypothetical protein AGOR_G00191320 [Albula goreensis]|uniref:Uncharacterized protein n=1 Tax=Albula goreensis TaxID=1534307 RepID=A0A8T3CT51_9TELE|nr:hypothetical protein AGOR_G00191320 [Albula goreensis]
MTRTAEAYLGRMKATLLLVCIIGSALGAPRLQLVELDLKPVLIPQQAQPVSAARPAALKPAELEILLALGAQPPAAPVLPARGFIKHEIPQAPGRESIEILYPFGFEPVAPLAPAAPVAPVAAAAPPNGDDDDTEDD